MACSTLVSGTVMAICGDGLVNGACGTFTGFRWSHGDSSTTQPDGIDIHLDNKGVGKKSHEFDSEGAVPGSTITRSATS